MSDPKQADEKDEYTEEETARRRDAVVKRMLKTPPKPRKKDGEKESGSHRPKEDEAS